MRSPKAPPQKPDIAETPYPANSRRSLKTSLAVLGGMLVFWLALVLGFLRIRDVQ